MIEFASDNKTLVVLRDGMVELCNPMPDDKSILLIQPAATSTVRLGAAR